MADFTRKNKCNVWNKLPSFKVGNQVWKCCQIQLSFDSDFGLDRSDQLVGGYLTCEYERSFSFKASFSRIRFWICLSNKSSSLILLKTNTWEREKVLFFFLRLLFFTWNQPLLGRTFNSRAVHASFPYNVLTDVKKNWKARYLNSKKSSVRLCFSANKRRSKNISPKNSGKRRPKPRELFKHLRTLNPSIHPCKTNFSENCLGSGVGVRT